MRTAEFDDSSFFIKKLKCGDAVTYAKLVDTYHHRLCFYAGNLLRDHIGAQDIVQNVFLKVWEHKENLDPELSIKSYLYKLVYNEFINSYRKKQTVQKIEKIYTESLNNLIEEQDPEVLERSLTAVKQGIEDLPTRCKDIFIMSKEEGLTNNEIAEHLQISIKTVEAQISKAYSLLRKKLGARTELLLLLYFRD